MNALLSAYDETRYDFKSWISSGRYLVRNIASSKDLEIEVNDEKSFFHMMTFDICRMSSASFETMRSIQETPNLPKACSWIIIKCYYAAFFSAHSLMKGFGYTCNQLEKGHAKHINDLGHAAGLTITTSLNAGFFSGKYNSETRKLTLILMQNTHEDTWQTLLKCLQHVSKEVLTVQGLTTEKQSFSAYIDGIVDRLNQSGRLPKGNYLSNFRNAVNYRHEHDSWHPYGKKSLRSDKILDLISKWQEDQPPVVPVWKESIDTYNFFLTCRDLINLNYLLIKLITKNSPNIKNLYAQWPNKLLQLTART